MNVQTNVEDSTDLSTAMQPELRSPLVSSTQFWRKVLQGQLPVLDLPVDKARPSTTPTQNQSVDFTMDKELCATLSQLAASRSVSLFVLLLTAYKILLHRWSGQDDIIVGTESDALQTMSPLVLRTELSGEEPFCSLLEKVKTHYDEAFGYGQVSLDQLIAIPGIRTEPGRHPVFQTRFAVLDSAPAAPKLGNGSTGGRSHVDLTLLLEVQEGNIQGRLLFSNALFRTETIERLAAHFQTLLASIVENPISAIGRLCILPEEERQKILIEWNNTAAPYPETKCVHELFEEQAAMTPDAVAVVFGDEQLTYHGLNEQANRLAKYLRGLGVTPDTRVGVCMMRSLEMIIALYAIHKAGGAYVPMDPSYPAERIAFMLEDAQVPVLLTQKPLLGLLPQTNARVVCVDDAAIGECPNPKSSKTAAPTVSSDNLAYVIYTSGSTGKPKGVMVRHRNVVNFMVGMDAAIGREPGVWLAVTSISFDIHVLELFWTLTRGFKVILQGDDAASSRLRSVRAQVSHGATYTMPQQIQRHAVTHLQCTPSLAAMMLEDDGTRDALRRVKKFMFGGEPLPVSLVERLSGYGEIYNMYGPTETTVWSTVQPVTRSGGIISIGRPVANTQIYILDKFLQPAPIGVAGELCIGGAGVVRGYLHRPELTAERFIHSPFSRDPRVRIYRTGDLARFQPDGTIQFLGRLDHQVKIRGFRIELGEIETAMRQWEGVKDSIVSVWQAGPNDTRLVGYFVPQPSAQVEVTQLRKHLKAKLPEYMVPSTFIGLAALPLTPNGKVDRKALPLPEAPNASGGETTPQASQESAAPPEPEQKGQVVKTLPLTEAQREIWYGSQMSDEVSCSFNQSVYLMLNGQLDGEGLLKSLRWLVERHEALRVTFAATGDAQLVHASMPMLLTREDLSGAPAEKGRQQLEQLLQEEVARPFDLANGPLFRTRLVRLGANEHALLLTLHHIICDGCSVAVLLEDLAQSYSAQINGASPPAQLEMTYSQFVEQQEASTKTLERQETEAFWLEQYAQPAPTLAFPADHTRPAKRKFSGGTATRRLSAALSQNVKRLSAQQRCTTTTTLLATYYLLLHRLSGQKEIVIGLPMTSRLGPGSDRLIGHCVNFLPLRLSVDEKLSFTEHMKRVWKLLMEAHQHQNFTLGSLLQKLNRPREHGRMPLTSVMFNLDWVQEPLRMEGMLAEVRANPHCQVRFDFSLSVSEREGRMELFGQYSSELLEESTVQRWLEHYETLFSALVINPEQKLMNLPSLNRPDGQLEMAPQGAVGMQVDGAMSPKIEVTNGPSEPSGPIEQGLAQIWREVIGLQELGRNDDFFDVGGHSLLATKVTARITKMFNVELPVRTIFEAPTIAELAQAVTRAQQESSNTVSTITRRTKDLDAEQLLKRLEKLSDAEIRALLEKH